MVAHNDQGVIQEEDVDFTHAAKVKVVTNRFVIPVPAAPGNGQLAMEPDTGKPIYDKTGAQKRGLVFRNFVDKAWQVAKQDGSGVILINEVLEEDGPLIVQMRTQAVARLGNTAAAVHDILADLADMGYEDHYNSSRTGLADTLRTVPGRVYDSEGAGLYLREGKTVEAVRIVGDGLFQGPVVHAFEGEAVLIRHAPGKVNLCQADVFERTYFFEDGSPARVSELPVGFTCDNHALGTPQPR